MIAAMIVLTIFFILKLAIDYVTLKAGVTTITTIRGFLVGFDFEEVTNRWKNEETNENGAYKQISFEVALGFIGFIFTWQEDTDDGETGD